MKKLFLVLVLGFVFNLAFANSYDDDVGKYEKAKIEYNQNVDVMIETDVAEITSFSYLLSGSTTAKAVIYIDKDIGNEFAGNTEVKLPDIISNNRCNSKNLTTHYSNHKFGSAGGLSEVSRC